MKWVTVTENQRFRVGDTVRVDGRYKGIGEVFCTHYEEHEAGRQANGGGEISYLFKVGESFPQIGVRIEDGNDIHYNGDDLAMGKITLVSRPDKEKDYVVGINPFTGAISIG